MQIDGEGIEILNVNIVLGIFFFLKRVPKTT